MKKHLLVIVALAAFAVPPLVQAQVSSTANGGAGGAGGSAAGGSANGGTSTSTNNTTGTSSATGGTANIGAAASNIQGSDVSVNYTTPAGAAGVNGLAPGVDPSNNHVVSDNNVHYGGTTKIKNTPDVTLGGPASGPCNGASGGLGVGIPGLAVGANISTVDKGCEARETARVAAMLGRIDVANAILENMDVVVAALNAKSDREARAAADANQVATQARSAAIANASIERATRDHDAAIALQAARDRESNAMRLQQQAGVEALARQATMAKVNDTLSFTAKLTQGEEKTPQQVMAEQDLARQAVQRQQIEQRNAVARDADRIAAEKIVADRALAATRAATEKSTLQASMADARVPTTMAAATKRDGPSSLSAAPASKKSGPQAQDAAAGDAPDRKGATSHPLPGEPDAVRFALGLDQ